MSRIKKLTLTGLRNLVDVAIDLSPRMNIFYGENGSGKTSLLEGIHLLSSGRSFRSVKLDPLITHGKDEAVIFSQLTDGLRIGLSKSRRRRHLLRLQDETQKNWESVARSLPLQIIDSTAFQLLEGGPKARRRFLDWGVFHVEHSFLTAWRDSRKCLVNRNALLKASRLDRPQLEAWNREFVAASIKVDAQRGAYLDRLLPVFKEVYAQLEGSYLDSMEIRYERGWAEGTNLDAELVRTEEADRRYGSTQLGPQRADLLLLINRAAAVEVLSRGQQKILVSALKIAQGRLLSESLGVECLYLIDDLPSELDPENRARVFSALLSLDAQLFVTCVELESLALASKGLLFTALHPSDIAQFHVEHGRITN